jgi:hypothetical protein
MNRITAITIPGRLVQMAVTRIAFSEGFKPGTDALLCNTFRDTNATTMNATPKFSEMQKVRTCIPGYGSQLEGYVIANKF